jgi:hypothetical protein
MVKIRVFPFIREKLKGEGPNGADVTNVEEFKDWVIKYGKVFTHVMGAGDEGDVIVFAWRQEPGEWLPVGDAIVLLSRQSVDGKSIEIATKAVRIYPAKKVPALKAGPGDDIIGLSSKRYGDLIAKAYR